MKFKILIGLVATCLIIFGYKSIFVNAESNEEYIKIDEVHFPNEEFREVVSEFDLDGDKYLSDDEICEVTKIDASCCRGNLKGIEFFSELKELWCWRCELTELDVSHNLELTDLSCYDNNLTYLDLSHNKKLDYLVCSENKLSTLNLSNNTVLTAVDCSKNNITKLDVSKNSQLDFLVVSQNKLTSLDLSKNFALKDFSCEGNDIYSLDLSNNLKLDSLHIDENTLLRSSVDVNKLSWFFVYIEKSSNFPYYSILPLTKITDFDPEKVIYNYGTEQEKKNLISELKSGYKSGAIYNSRIVKKDSTGTLGNENLIFSYRPSQSQNSYIALYYYYTDNIKYSAGQRVITSNQTAAFKVNSIDNNGNISLTLLNPVNKRNKSFTVPDQVFLPDMKKAKVTSIGDKAFKNNTKLKKVRLNSNIDNIGTSAFENCKSLTSINLNQTNIKIVKSATFKECIKLKGLTFPKGISKIGTNAFKDCKSLKTININTEVLNSVGKKAIKGINKKATIVVPKKKLKYYKKLFKAKTGFKKTMRFKGED